MSEKDFQILSDLAAKERRKEWTKEEALRSLIDAGILNKDGQFTPPYKNLGQVIVSK